MATLITSLILLSAVLGSGVAVFVWVFRDTSGAKPLAGFMVAASVLALAEGLALAAPALADKLFWSSVAATVSPALPLTWLATVMTYADSDRAPRGRVLAALLVEPVAFVALVWTNADHALVWTDRWIETIGGSAYLATDLGLAMWAHIGYSYLLIAAGCLALVRLNFRTTEVFRDQSTALIGAVTIPAGLTALTLYGGLPAKYDLSGVGFVVAGLLTTATLFRGRLLSVTPATRQLGREAVIDEMDDRIVIVDDDDRVVDVNPAAADLLGVDPDAVVGSPLEAVAPKLAAAVGSLDGGQTELELEGADGRHFYDVRVSPLYRNYGGLAGRVVSFRDVTDRRRREQRLDVLNRVLRHNLRNELNVVRGNAELLRRDLDTSTDRTLERLDRIEETVDTVSTRSEKIAQVSREVDEQTDGTFDVATRLESLAETVESRYSAVTVEVRLPSDPIVVGGPPLERAFEELLENAAEHAGGAPTVRVTVDRRDDDFTEVRVADDGPGIERQERVVIEEERETALEHGSGVGLWLVNWVVRECGGDVEFAATDEGTAVVVTLPEADATDDPVTEPGDGDDEPNEDPGPPAEVEADD